MTESLRVLSTGFGEQYVVSCGTLNCRACAEIKGETVEVADDAGMTLTTLLQAAADHHAEHHMEHP